MKFSSLFVLFFLTLRSVVALCGHDSTSFNCVKFLKNYDGDTITVDIDGQHQLFGKNISIRVRGIDTPEIKGGDKCEKEAARKARNLVTNLLKNAKRIDLKNASRGKFFRVVADVVYDGENLSEILIKNKLAVEYDGGRKEVVNWCFVK